MHRKLIRSVLLTTVFISTAVLNGCTTMADLKTAKGTGIVSICNEPYDLAWAGLLDMLTSIRVANAYLPSDPGFSYFKPTVVDPEKGEIVARGAHVAGVPEVYVAMYVTPLGENKTKVEILSRQAVTVTLSAHWEQIFTDSIKSGCSRHQTITQLPWAMTL